jgi:hypothetical protein
MAYDVWTSNDDNSIVSTIQKESIAGDRACLARNADDLESLGFIIGSTLNSKYEKI